MYNGLCFLCHLNRSGSTLLAKELDSRFNAFVSIEARFVNRIVRNYKLPMDQAEFERFRSDLRTDEKFSEWNISEERLNELFDKLKFPVGMKEIFNPIMEETTTGHSYDYFILKAGKYHFYYQKLKKEFPDAKFIFIRRDPRAVFNSLSKTKRSASNEVMLDDVARFCWTYRKSDRVLATLKGKSDFLIVDYEELITEPDMLFQKVSTFLGADLTQNGGSYSERVPAKQQHLHANIVNAGMGQRIEAWRKELTPFHIRAIQELLGSEMKTNGYTVEPVALRTLDLAKWWLTKARFVGYELRSSLSKAAGR
ncbi:MAG: hypothetical protein RL266_465 [Bacteroidota bacterium]